MSVSSREVLEFPSKIEELHKHGALAALEYIDNLEKRLRAGSKDISTSELIYLLRGIAGFRNRHRDEKYQGPNFIKFKYTQEQVNKVIGYCWVVECKWHINVDSDDTSVTLWMADPDSLIYLRLVMDTW